ncbi:hypothetical protein [Ectorhizobium quercum]|uniref:hypothetical protein n=1 Tax=Ectorhizobium quercum TaxID=2965071 RepID=UPI0027957186|nr:hypothetical protein [Ectorhizobium quercum]
MTQKARTSTAIPRSEHEELLEAMLVDVPELSFTPRGDPDPRLVRLARLLGEQMARQDFAAQAIRRGSRRSR